MVDEHFFDVSEVQGNEGPNWLPGIDFLHPNILPSPWNNSVEFILWCFGSKCSSPVWENSLVSDGKVVTEPVKWGFINIIHGLH